MRGNRIARYQPTAQSALPTRCPWVSLIFFTPVEIQQEHRKRTAPCEGALVSVSSTSRSLRNLPGRERIAGGSAGPFKHVHFQEGPAQQDCSYHIPWLARKRRPSGVSPIGKGRAGRPRLSQTAGRSAVKGGIPGTFAAYQPGTGKSMLAEMQRIRMIAFGWRETSGGACAKPP